MARRYRSVNTSPIRKSADGADLLEVRIIGRFDVLHQGEPARSSRNSARLVAYLALHPGMQPRITVASHLWTDVTQARALACLPTALWKTRSDHLRLVDALGPALRLAEAVEVDLHHMVDDAQRLIGCRTNQTLEPLEPADYTRDLLPDWD
jgi:DNA-binding SARP family transcriptional activator